MKKRLFYALLTLLPLGAIAQNSVSSTYTAGDISTKYQLSSTITVTSENECAATQTITIPAGSQVTSVSTSYSMTSANTNYTAQQRSVLSCTTCGTGGGATFEDAINNGAGAVVGTQTYNRTGLTFANGATGTITIALKAWRVNPNGGTDCNTGYQKVDNNSWVVTVYYGCLQPAAPTAITQTFCATANPTVANLTANGIAGATYKWYTALSGGTALAATTPLATGVYFVSQTSSSCESNRTAVNVTVNGAAIVQASQTFCTGTLTSLLLSSATPAIGGTLNWTTPSGVAAVPNQPLVSGNYTVTQTIGSCAVSTPVNVTITVTPPPTVQTLTLCAGATGAQLTATAAAGGTLHWFTATGTAVAATDILTAGTYTVSQTVNGCTSVTANVPVTILTVPAPTAQPLQLCLNTTAASLTATGETGATFNWFAPSGSVVTTTDTLVQGTYQVSQTLNGCTSTRTNVPVTLSVTPAPLASPLLVCNTATGANLTATASAGATLNWISPSGAPVSPTDALVQGNYKVSQTLNGCTSQLITVSVTFKTIPLPTVAPLSLCSTSTGADLTATATTGATLNWISPSGSPVNTADALVEGIYKVSQTIDGCTGATANVAVTFAVIPAPQTQAASLCSGSTVAALSAEAEEGASLNWFSPDGEAVAPTDILVDGTYTVSQTINGCTGTTATLPVTIKLTPDAPEGETDQTFNEGDTVAALAITFNEEATVQWYLLNEEEELVSITTETELVDGGVYYASQTIDGCTGEYIIITAEAVLGNERFDINGLRIYPNPTADIITILATDTISSISVYNMLGQEVLNKSTNGTETAISLTAIAQGTYIVKISANSKTSVVKIVKQ